MKKMILIQSILSLAVIHTYAFCGFYVAKADAKLFNKSSQVILVRNGEKQTITMSNDFQGNVKDFAMVVPVPTVLKKEQIRITDQSVFDKLDAYSGPRLTEYYDENPCRPRIMYERMAMNKSMAMPASIKEDMAEEKKDYHVTVEATYTVGEYDILILSAKESDGLKYWLLDNGYKIPAKAEEVLEPYIKSNMKFFVVKVNMEEKQKAGFNNLRPLQLTFQSPKFILPIRLGMANAESTQDLIIYAFSKTGRIETTNYKTLKIPTDKNVPEFVKDKFGVFYKDLFETSWKKDKASVYLEYAWNLNSDNYMHCDPCSSTPPRMAEFKEAGVDWLENPDYNKGFYGSTDYMGNAFFTRLHVRYDRLNFPQDLVFQETPNQENFQGRYILNHPVQEKLDCKQAYDYYKTTYERRKDELKNLHELTGWDMANHSKYAADFGYAAIKSYKEGNYTPRKKKTKHGSILNTQTLSFFVGGSFLLFLISLGVKRFRKETVKK